MQPRDAVCYIPTPYLLARVGRCTPLSRSTRSIATLLSMLPAIAVSATDPLKTFGEARTMMHDGIERAFLLRLPQGVHDVAGLPLVLVLHGGHGSGEKVARVTAFADAADRHGFVAVFPDAVGTHWNDGRGQPGETADDVGFLSALAADLAREFELDRRRVYATGISNGGMMALRLGAEATELFAAIACVAASIPEPVFRKRRPSAPLPVLIINGDADPVVPWEGGEVRVQSNVLGRVVSTEEMVRFWVEHNGCAPAPEIAWLPDADPHDGMRVRVETYRGGADDARVTLYVVEGGGHAWPGGEQYLPDWVIGKTARDIDATEDIWRFFDGFTR